MNAGDPDLASLGIRLIDAPNGQFLCPNDPTAGRSSVTREEGRILAAAASGRRVLEFGTGLGVSALYMAALATKLVTIDPDSWVHEHVKLPRDVIRVRTFVEVKPGGFDLAFIDGLHDETSAQRDIRFALLRMATGDVIAFHDSHHPGVRLAIEAFAPRFDRVLTLPTAGQLTFARVA